MSDLVLYRKHRPQKFGEVVGQDHVVRSVSYAIAQGRPAHAYLFSGQRGVGKTTLARLIAKAVNCQDRKSGEVLSSSDLEFEPCNECESCQAIDQRHSMDIQEMDAASNRGIDEIRELIESIKYPPSNLSYKVVIVDEVHMLTKEAFNALLKTLEEPPEHALFVLATTEIEKVPDTIISRCQRFDFHKINLPQIQKRLEHICAKEDLDASEEALRLIAVNSGGSMRDAESLLQQVISQADEKLTLEETKDMLGVVDEQYLLDFVESVFKEKPQKALALVEEVLEQGRDLEQFIIQALQYFRFVMLAEISTELLEDEFLTKEQKKWSKKLADQVAPKQASQAVEIFSEAHRSLYEYPMPQIALEIAVIESTDLLEEED